MGPIAESASPGELLDRSTDDLMKVGPSTQDVEVVWMQRFLDSGQLLDLGDREQFQAAIELRKAEIVSGLAHPIAKRWTKKLQKEVEPLLRMRLDPRLGFVIDRWVEAEGYWHKIPGAIGFEEPRSGLCERMRTDYDMWKKSTPEDDKKAMRNEARHPILKQKDQVSAKVLKANEQKATEKVLAAVDSLSTKQVENFLAVEKARHTGEKIVHHGPDLRFMEHLESEQKKGNAAEVSPDMGEDCGNPGMNPKVYKRAKGGKHIRE
jgi:hypothetical protein